MTRNTWIYNASYGWVQWLTGETPASADIVLHNVHSGRDCRYIHCVIHNPMAHHMEDWTLIWRNDRGIFERICPKHGCGHPDPNQFEHWEETDQMYQGVHGCCGCCNPAVPV